MPVATETIRVRVAPETATIWRQAAEAAETSVSDLIREGMAMLLGAVESHAMRVVSFRVEQAEHEAWKSAAERQGVSLSEFVRASVERGIQMGEAGGRILTGEGMTPERRQPVVPGRRGKTSAQAARPAGCARERHHRKGVYCRECGTTP